MRTNNESRLNRFYILCFVGIIILGFTLRIVRIFYAPPGITNDELGYVYNAYSIAKTGMDIYGNRFPILFHIGNWPFMPIPTYALASIFLFVPPTLLTARLMNIILGTAGIGILIILVDLIYKDKRLALLSGLVLAFSPWHVHFSRTAYDGPVAIFLYLVGILYGCIASRKHWFLFPMYIFVALGVGSHRASSVIAIPITLVTFWYLWPSLVHRRRYVIELVIGILFILGIFLMLVHIQKSGAQGMSLTQEVSLLNKDAITKAVNEELNQSDAPLWIRRVFNNKFTYVFRVFRENYLHMFSPQFLFTSGEADGIYSPWWRGQLYLIDLPLLIAGLIYLFRKKNRANWFVIGSVLMAPIPAAISSQVYSMRGYYFVYFYPIIIAAGIGGLGKWIERYSSAVRFSMVTFGVIAYGSFVLSYLYQYHYRYSNYGAERWFKSEKDLALVVGAPASRYQERVIAQTGGVDVVLQYAFYNRLHPRIVQEAIAQASKDEISLPGGIRFVRFCAYGNRPVETFLTPSMLYITRDSCQETSKPTEVIYAPKSIRVWWKVYRGDLFPRPDKPATDTIRSNVAPAIQTPKRNDLGR